MSDDEASDEASTYFTLKDRIVMTSSYATLDLAIRTRIYTYTFIYV